jgi:hypothetical protein
MSVFLRVVTRRHVSPSPETWTLLELIYDWRFTASQFFLATTPWDSRRDFFPPNEHLRSLSLCNIPSDERMGMSFTIAAHQRSHSQVRVLRDSWPHFTASDSRLSQVPYFYAPGTGCPGYTPRHWVPFSSPPTTRRATVEVFDPCSARVTSTLKIECSQLQTVPWGRSVWTWLVRNVRPVLNQHHDNTKTYGISIPTFRQWE